MHVAERRSRRRSSQGTEPKSFVSARRSTATETWSRDGERDVAILGEVLEIRLREVLREDMGGVYGVQASAGDRARAAAASASFDGRFGCAPENVDKLMKAVFDEIKTVQNRRASATTTSRR